MPPAEPATWPASTSATNGRDGAVEHAHGGTRMSHTHNHEGDALTFGCPACIVRVRQTKTGQHSPPRPSAAARGRSAYYPVNREHGELTFTLDASPPGWDGWQVDEEYAGETGAELARLAPDDCMDAVDFGSVECDIGPIVGTQQPKAMLDQPDLFGARHDWRVNQRRNTAEVEAIARGRNARTVPCSPPSQRTTASPVVQR